jgi:proteasome lid subunit RPN8/RPN11
MSLPADSTARLVEFLSRNPRAETGCLVTVDGEVIPMTNTSTRPYTEFLASVEDFDRMAGLLLENRLYGWAHSHIGCPARPSVYDIRAHQFPVRMLIYSIPDQEIGEFTADEINSMAMKLSGRENEFSLIHLNKGTGKWLKTETRLQ